jgi:septum formation protein
MTPRGDFEQHLLPPHKTVLINAKSKVESVIDDDLEGIYIGVDTIVYCDNRILGKPRDRNEAFQTLRLLSGRKHTVYSGIYLYDNANHSGISECVETDVYFRKLKTNEIKWYIDTGEPFDKAGAYGIQGYASLFIERIDGCYYNVMGFPIERFYMMLGKLGYDPLKFIGMDRKPK